MLDGDTCGLGFTVETYSETVLDTWRSGVCPKDGTCDQLPMPTTISEFVKLAHERGIDWELDEIVEMEGA